MPGVRVQRRVIVSEIEACCVSYVIKAEIRDAAAPTFTFAAQKTMYGGKQIRVGDEIFLFASENEGGVGLIGVGIVTSAAATPRRLGHARQTPRVTIAVRRTAGTACAMGRAQLRPFVDWADARPETELNFKLYRQATNKVVGVTPSAAAFLRQCTTTT
jgi:hypothetical protein